MTGMFVGRVSSNKEVGMNWNIVEGDWKQSPGKVKARWGELPYDQTDMIAGKRDKHADKVPEAYRTRKDEAQKRLRTLQRQNKDERSKSYF